MAPDDLKFVRMEAQLREQQQQVMAELGLGQSPKSSGKRDSDEAIARGGFSETPEQHNKMNFLLDSGRFQAPKLLVNGKECQNYGACDQSTTTTMTSVDNISSGGDLAWQKKHVRQLDATIGGNKSAARLEQKFGAEGLEAAATGASDLSALVESGRQSFGDGNQNNKRQRDQEEPGPEPCAIQRLAKVVPCFGIMLALCASCCLGTAGMLVKLIHSVHGIEVAVLRAVIQLVIYASLICGRQQRRWLPPRGELLPVALRAIFGGSSITFSYYALKLIPLGDATTIRFSLPIWTLIMGYFFLHESCSLVKVLAVVISISGVVLVTKPDDCIHLFNWLMSALFSCNLSNTSPSLAWPMNSTQTWLQDNESKLLPDANESRALQDIEEIAMLVDSPPPLSRNPLGAASIEGPSFSQVASASGQQQQQRDVLEVVPLVGARGVPSDPLRQLEGCSMALASSVCLAISITALRMCKQTPSEVTIFWLSTSSVTIGSLTLIMLSEWSVPNNLADCLFILLNGVCGALGQWFMTNALKVEQSGLVSLARTFDIEVAFLYSALLLDEQIRTTSIIGSVLVSLGVIIVLVPRWLNCSALDGHDDDDERSRNRSNALTPPQTDTTSESDSATSQSETVASILNERSLDGRRSFADMRAVECLRSECLKSSSPAAADKSLV